MIENLVAPESTWTTESVHHRDLFSVGDGVFFFLAHIYFVPGKKYIFILYSFV